MRPSRLFRSWKLPALAAVAVVAAAAGASHSAASDTNYCNQPDPTGRQFCIRVVDTDGVSPSGTEGSGKLQTTVTAYQYYEFTVANVGGSTLTNGSMTVTLMDNVPDGKGGSKAVASTAQFISSSAAFCAVTNPANVVRCTLPNLTAGGSVGPFRFVFRTSTSPGVTRTDANVTASFKEGTNPKGANPSSLTFTENTSLEPDPEQSVSYSPPGLDVQEGTSPTFDQQFTTLAYKVPSSHAAFLSHLAESSASICPSTLACFGETVTTDLAAADSGTFTSTNPFHITIVMSLDLVPTGNTSKIVVFHQKDSGDTETISARCSSSPPATSDPLPCILVQKDTKAKVLIVDIWGFENGSWGVG